MSDKKIKVGISIGDLNGIGLEVIIKSLSDNRILDLMTPIIYSSAKVVSYHKKAIGAHDFSFQKIQEDKEPKGKHVFIKECWKEDVDLDLGTPNEFSGRYAIKSLKVATEDLAAGKIDALVTAPIDKNNVQSASFDFPGHTEYLAKTANVEEALMLLVSDNLRVAVATGHIPLKDVVKNLDKDKIQKKIAALNQSLIADFGIVKPRIAVLGINPHAGDDGVIGDEDQTIVAPAVKTSNGRDILTFGPYPADGFFGNASYLKFDGVLAMYHDQGLAPFKTISFGNGVNFTAGLPIVRTSPDHGTAFDIAGKGVASEASFRNALYKAVEIFKTRNNHKEMTANPLIVSRRR